MVTTKRSPPHGSDTTTLQPATSDSSDSPTLSPILIPIPIPIPANPSYESISCCHALIRASKEGDYSDERDILHHQPSSLTSYQVTSQSLPFRPPQNVSQPPWHAKTLTSLERTQHLRALHPLKNFHPLSATSTACKQNLPYFSALAADLRPGSPSLWYAPQAKATTYPGTARDKAYHFSILVHGLGRW